jgi:hypothetical protein
MNELIEMANFNWKLWGKTLLAAVAGAVLNSLATSGTIFARGGSVSWKDIAAGAGAAALTTVIGYLRKSPLASSVTTFDDSERIPPSRMDWTNRLPMRFDSGYVGIGNPSNSEQSDEPPKDAK